MTKCDARSNSNKFLYLGEVVKFSGLGGLASDKHSLSRASFSAGKLQKNENTSSITFRLTQEAPKSKKFEGYLIRQYKYQKIELP